MTKNKKPIFSRGIALFLLLLMTSKINVMAIEPITSGTQKVIDYNDHWGKDAISYALSNKYLTGYPNGSFKPDNSITRAELATVLTKMFNLKPTDAHSFTDLVKNAWYTDYVTAVFNAKIMTGTSLLQFEPDKKMSREEVAVAMAKAYKLEPSTSSLKAFNDDDKISKNNLPLIKALKDKGLVKGDLAGNFNPTSLVKRADTVQIIYNQEVVIPQQSKESDTPNTTKPDNNKTTLTLTQETKEETIGKVKINVDARDNDGIKFIGYTKSSNNEKFTDGKGFKDITNAKSFLVDENGYYTVCAMDSNYHYTFSTIRISNIKAEEKASEKASASPTATPTPVASPTPTPTPEASPTPTPVASPTPTPSEEASAEPSASA